MEPVFFGVYCATDVLNLIKDLGESDSIGLKKGLVDVSYCMGSIDGGWLQC